MNHEETFSANFEPLPSTSMVSNMVSELGVVSKCHAVQSIFHTKIISLAWNATSINFSHVNEICLNICLKLFFWM